MPKPILLASFLLLTMASLSFSDEASGAVSQDGGEDPWLGRDKASHLALSLSLVGFGYHLARCEGDLKAGPARAASIGASLSLGLTKEIWDRRRPGGRFSYRDLLFDLAGAGLGLLVFTTNK